MGPILAEMDIWACEKSLTVVVGEKLREVVRKGSLALSEQ